MPSGEADDRAKEYKNSYLGILLPLDKFLLLTDGKIIKTDGIPYVTDSNAVMDPAVTVFSSKKEMKFLWTNTEKRPWRELTALLGFAKRSQVNAEPPYFLSFGLQKLRGKQNLLTFWTGGLSVSSDKGEQTLKLMNDYVESEFTISCANISPSLQTYEKQLLRIEKLSEILKESVKKYFTEVSGEKNIKENKRRFSAAKGERVIAIFWEKMESHAQTIFTLSSAGSTSEDDWEKEKKRWWKIVFELYDEFCPHETAQQIEAWAEAHPNQKIILDKTNKNETEGNEMDDKKSPAAFVNFVIRKIKDNDTEFRAAMSRADNPALESCAWEYLIPYCNIEYEAERMAFALIGAAIARNRPDADCDSGLGNSFRSVCKKDEDDERELRRFRRIIACDTVQELVPVLRPQLNYLASKGAGIGYTRLLYDLLYWNKDKARIWMIQFFHKSRQAEEAEA